MENSTLVILLFVLGGLILLFFVMRSIMTWYWRIDEIVTNQAHQNKLIYEQNQLLRQLCGVKGTPKEEIEKKAKLFDQS